MGCASRTRTYAGRAVVSVAYSIASAPAWSTSFTLRFPEAVFVRPYRFSHLLVAVALACSVHTLGAQPEASFAGMRWRQIGPTRAGRARALSGVATQPSVFYIGFDNGGVWRSTDYGSNWEPIFDKESTGSIGAIAVAPSDPNIIYVGSGAGIIRPDLAVGDGM